MSQVERDRERLKTQREAQTEQESENRGAQRQRERKTDEKRRRRDRGQESRRCGNRGRRRLSPGRTGRAGGGRVAGAPLLAPDASRPDSPAWGGPLPPVSPRRPLCSSRLPAAPPRLGRLWVPAVRSCRLALLRRALPRRGSARCGRGGGTLGGHSRRGAGGEAPVGSAPLSPPTGVSHRPYGQTREEGALESYGDSCEGE